MKSTGKIVVMFISLFVLSAIFWFINLENGGEGISPIGLVITIGFSWFISYSKWANDNIWKTKSIPNSKSKTNKLPEVNNENSGYIKIDKKSIYVIAAILGIVIIFYFGYNLGSSNENKPNQSVSTEILQQDNNDILEETNLNKPPVNKEVQSTTKKTYKYKPSSNEIGNLKGYHLNEVNVKEETNFYNSKPFKSINFYSSLSGSLIEKGYIYNDFGVVAKLLFDGTSWDYIKYDSYGNVIEVTRYSGNSSTGKTDFIEEKIYFNANGKITSWEEYQGWFSTSEEWFPGWLQNRWVCSSSVVTKYNGEYYMGFCKGVYEVIEKYELVGWNNQKGDYDVRLRGNCYGIGDSGGGGECYNLDGSVMGEGSW
jgi:hypothetical protein